MDDVNALVDSVLGKQERFDTKLLAAGATAWRHYLHNGCSVCASFGSRAIASYKDYKEFIEEQRMLEYADPLSVTKMGDGVLAVRKDGIRPRERFYQYFRKITRPLISPGWNVLSNLRYPVTGFGDLTAYDGALSAVISQVPNGAIYVMALYGTDTIYGQEMHYDYR